MKGGYSMCSVIGFTPMINLEGIELSAVLDEIVALIPTVLPVVIGFIAFRKGFAFIKQALKGA